MAISVIPQTPSFVSAETQKLLEQEWGEADSFCRRDRLTGAPYIDTLAVEKYVSQRAGGSLVQAWNTLKSTLPSQTVRPPKSSDDPVIGWKEAFAGSGIQPRDVIERVFDGNYQEVEQAWVALCNADGDPRLGTVTLTTIVKNFQDIQSALLTNHTSKDVHGHDLRRHERANVGGCFAQAGLAWVIVFCFIVVLVIVATVASGGTFSAVVAAVLTWIWAAGIWASVGAIVDLMVCLCNTLNARCSLEFGPPPH